MPLYEFECLECGIRFETLVRRSSEKADVECPACGSRKLEDLLSTFASGPQPGGECAPSGG